MYWIVSNMILLKLSCFCLLDHGLVCRNVDLYTAVLSTALIGGVVSYRHVE